MELEQYFESTPGTGVLVTADADGNVNGALYSRPHFLENGQIAFIMADRLSHHNLASNPKAAYIFIKAGSKGAGKRLYLAKTHEESDPDMIQALRRRSRDSEKEGNEPKNKFIVYFTIEKVLPLIGAGE